MAGVPRVQIVEKAWVNTDADTDVHHTSVHRQPDLQINYWIMLTNTAKVCVSNPLSGQVRDQLLTLGVFPGQ